MDTKAWYLSKTVWGALVAIIAQALVLLGIFTPELDTAAVQGQLQDPATIDRILNLVTVVASAFAIYGRAKSQTALTK